MGLLYIDWNFYRCSSESVYKFKDLDFSDKDTDILEFSYRILGYPANLNIDQSVHFPGV